ncbi:MAG TPA: hypothetical protein VKX28_02925 [Xanthobacteraceae bacterium]|nr:hypothetical protein [Xanthobacteraceae bacterium]
MIDYMLVRQKVKDLAQLQRAFDDMKQHRKAAEVTHLGQFCDAEEPDTAVVVVEAPTSRSPARFVTRL